MKSLFSKGGFEMQSAFLKAGIGFAILFSVMLAVSSAAPEPPSGAAKADNPGPLPAGATWTYERRDSGSFGSGTVQITTKSLGEQTWQGRKVYAYEGPETTDLFEVPSLKWAAVVKGPRPSSAMILPWALIFLCG